MTKPQVRAHMDLPESHWGSWVQRYPRAYLPENSTPLGVEFGQVPVPGQAR